MADGGFGRLSRKWWLMLVIGVVIGLGMSIPLQSALPDSLFGIALDVPPHVPNIPYR